MHVLEKFKYCPVCGSEHFEEQNAKSKCCENCGFEYYLNPSAAVAAFILNRKASFLSFVANLNLPKECLICQAVLLILTKQCTRLC